MYNLTQRVRETRHAVYVFIIVNYLGLNFSSRYQITTSHRHSTTTIGGNVLLLYRYTHKAFSFVFHLLEALMNLTLMLCLCIYDFLTCYMLVATQVCLFFS